MSAYDLPTSLTVGGVGYSIRYQWRAVLDILVACADPDLDENGKAECVIKIMYPQYKEIPKEHMHEALIKACNFIDCGQRDDGKAKPKMIDWDQDASIIIPEINKIAGKEVRVEPNIHWWTFFGWFMGIGDGLLAYVLNIRSKKAKGKKLEKWEKEFYDANKTLVDFSTCDADKIRAEKESIMKYL